jgi:hypothetical protein
MWQLGWMFSLIPDSLVIWVIDTVLLVGVVATVAGFFIKFIPFVNTYKLPIQLLGVFLLAAGLFFKGGYSTEMVWRERVAEMEKKVAEAEAKSAKTNTVIQKVYVDKVKVVKDTQYVIQERIKEVEKLIDKECKVAPEAIDIHNDSAKNRRPGGSK